MKIVFQAIDGKIFDSHTEAEQYEQQLLNLVQMRDMTGEPTTAAIEAYFIRLAPKGGEAFISISRAQGGDSYTTAGIDEEATGLFMWDEGHDEYVWISDEAVNALRKILVS